MRHLLDTCALSELIRSRADRGFIEWFDSQDENELHVSVLAVGELEKGVAKLPASRRRERLARWLEEDVKERFAERLLEVDLEVATMWGRIQAEAETRGEKLPIVDGLMAATAIVNDCVVVTRNPAHFERAGARVLNPWSA